MIVPDALRALFVEKLQSKHKGALPATLETGRVYRPVDPAAQGHRAELRVLVGQETGGGGGGAAGALYLDYFTESQEASSHQRIHADGRVTPLENYEGQFGIKSFPDPADTERERERVGAHNRRVTEILRQKGFVD